MLLSMMLILAVTSCALELMIAAKVPAWRRLSAKSPLFNLVNSLAISFVMGMAFGASGLIAMGAGVISTILSVPGYQFLKWNYDTPKAMALPEKTRVKHEAVKVKKLSSDLYTLGKGTAKVITIPVWLPRDYIYNPSKKVYKKIKSL